jgi:sarcosine/dimethylglycine N-methyltransferase
MEAPLFNDVNRRIQEHYGAFNAATSAMSDMAARGIDIDHLAPADLHGVDQLHTAGVGATRKMIDAMSADSSMRVLDVGSGLGGPARMLAAATGCSVEGIDLTPAFVAVATDFTRRTNQSSTVRFCVASATAIPFPDASFDAVWHIHMSMNVPGKAAMYREIARVLKPGGRFMLFDPIRGAGPDPVYPVPWADTATTSFVVTKAQMVETIVAAGLTEARVDDVTDEGLDWFAQLDAKTRSGVGVPPSRFAVMSANHRANLASGAISLMRAKFIRGT